MVTVYSEQTDPRFAPRGVLGGTDGRRSRITVLDQDGRPVPVGSKASLLVQPGSIIRIETSGGGGYGDPVRRDPALRAADEEDGRG
jgi:N-methylhydantoinase B